LLPYQNHLFLFSCFFQPCDQIQGPTVSPVYSKKNGVVEEDYYAITICVPKKNLYHAVKQLRKVSAEDTWFSPFLYKYWKIVWYIACLFCSKLN
jgi:hypothetical protein